MPYSYAREYLCSFPYFQAFLKNEINPDLVPSDEGENRESKKDGNQDGAHNLSEFGQLTLPKNESNIHVITIVGQVEGHLEMPPQNKATKYEHIIPQLVAVEQSQNIEGLIIILNTVGGDVEAGLAIAEMIASLSKPTVSLVLGGGHSIGVPIAVAAKTSFIAPTATMTIHPIRLTGMVVGVQQSFDYLERMQDRVISFISSHSHISAKKLKNMMMTTGELARDVGTIVVGENAVQCGLIDCLGGLDSAIADLRQQIQVYRAAKAENRPFIYSPKNTAGNLIKNNSRKNPAKKTYNNKTAAHKKKSPKTAAIAQTPEIEEGHGFLCTDIKDKESPVNKNGQINKRKESSEAFKNSGTQNKALKENNADFNKGEE